MLSQAVLAVSIGVPVLLCYVYAVVPIALCRSGTSLMQQPVFMANVLRIKVLTVKVFKSRCFNFPVTLSIRRLRSFCR